jgi:hypothetical protein
LPRYEFIAEPVKKHITGFRKVFTKEFKVASVKPSSASVGQRKSLNHKATDLILHSGACKMYLLQLGKGGGGRVT